MNQTTERSPRSAVGLSLLGVVLVLAIIDMVLLYQTRSVETHFGWGFRGFSLVLALPFAIIGALILTRYPRHIVGWMMMLLGIVSIVQGLFLEYIVFALYVMPNVLPGGVFAAWVQQWVWVVVTTPLVLIVVLFPDGRLPSARWRPLVWLWGGVTLLMIVLSALMPGPMTSSVSTLDNPYGWEAGRAILEAGFLVAMIGWVGSIGAAAAALITRYRRAQGATRQQLKWLAYAVGILAITSPVAGVSSKALQLLFIAGIVFLPVSIGIGILRYRLLDIDVVIRRTLVYGLVTGVLAAIYFGAVALLQSAFVTLTGQASPLAIVASTLATAALFTPLRNRVQRAVDRRFYRRKYDAEKTLISFAAAVRDEVDMDRLTAVLTVVVNETMQPAHVSLWLRADAPSGLTAVSRTAGGE